MKALKMRLPTKTLKLMSFAHKLFFLFKLLSFTYLFDIINERIFSKEEGDFL